MANHYRTLGVAPSAEDAVIRAAYVALMRTYHPDKNKDPEAQERVREITGAFSVLGDRQRRATYDALRALQHETGMGDEPYRPPRPPMRNVGLASVALAVIVSVAFAVWPQPEVGPRPRLTPTSAHTPERAQVAVTPVGPPTPEVLAHPAKATAPVAAGRAIEPVRHAPVHETASAAPKIRSAPVPRREVAQAALPKTPAPVPIVASRMPAPTSASAPSPAATDDRKAQIERIATGFLKQSLEHADSHKQELLLSAGSRSAASRAACRSDDCVTNAYLRQIRETTAIVEGRTPNE